VFHSPHGLPPSRGQEPDVSTARDLALLSRQLLTQTDILRYTSTRMREFRHANGVVNQFQNHNHLLGTVPGCDGLKTGWYAKAGYSLVATVQRNGRRIITVILGSPERKLRDITTTRLIERGFAALPPAVPPIAAAAPAAPVPSPSAKAAGPTAPATSVTAASAGSAESGTPLKLVPLQPGEESLLGEDPAKAPAVHVDLSGAKK
jgi:D-alanyl-D-alanine carboxypeptidase